MQNLVKYTFATAAAFALLAPGAVRADKALASKQKGKTLTALFQQSITCSIPREGQDPLPATGTAYAEVSYFEAEEKSTGTVVHDDVNVAVWSTCGESFNFSASGCTSFGSPQECWTEAVYAPKTVTVDRNLGSGRIVANVPLYGDSNGCGYSAEVTLDFVATGDKKTKYNDTWHYYGRETSDGPMLRYGDHSSATYQAATASGSIKINGWRNLDGTLAQFPVMGGGTSIDPCKVMPLLPSEFARGNVLWDEWDTGHTFPWTSIQESYSTTFRRIVERVPFGR